MKQIFKLKIFENFRVLIFFKKNYKNNFVYIFINYSNIFVFVLEYINYKMKDDLCKLYIYKYLNI